MKTNPEDLLDEIESLRTQLEESEQRMKDHNLKEITHDGQVLYRVGCRNCGGGDWAIFTDSHGKFVSYCFCGYKIELKKANLKNQPDNKPIDMRMVV